VRRCLALAFALLLAAGPGAAEVVVLSGGAIEPGILAAAQASRRASGVDVTVRFATAPAIRRLQEGEAADVLVIPAALAEELARAGAAAG
jgi:molybdate transport system substrate-binding protein